MGTQTKQILLLIYINLYTKKKLFTNVKVGFLPTFKLLFFMTLSFYNKQYEKYSIKL